MISIAAYRFLSVFEIKKIHGSSYPEDVLRRIFRVCFNQATIGANNNKLRVNHYIFSLSSPNFEWSIRAHYHCYDENTIESLLRRFELIDQSNMAKLGGRDSITAAPFVIDVTAIQSRLKPGRKRRHRGMGRLANRISYNMNHAALIPITNNDAFASSMP